MPKPYLSLCAVSLALEGELVGVEALSSEPRVSPEGDPMSPEADIPAGLWPPSKDEEGPDISPPKPEVDRVQRGG